MSELKQTDLSKRLRDIAASWASFTFSPISQKDMLATAEEIERYYTGMLNWKATAEAQSTQPEARKDDSLRTSLADLAIALWRTHYRNDSPNFELLPDAAGILSQIDNMVSGLVKPEATKPAQDLSAAVERKLGDTVKQILVPEDFGILDPELAKRAINFANAMMHQAALAATAAPVAAMQHPDDTAVDKFAVAMKDKMAASRTKGRSGWENPEECGIEDLACMLVQHVEKGDPVDIGNFCMMVWNRVRDTGPDTYAPIVEAFLSYVGDTAKPAPVTLPPVVGISRDAYSPGMTGVLVTFARPLSEGQLCELHEYLNRSQP